MEYREGAVVRGPLGQRRLALVFTAHEFAEGAPAILDTLARHRARASFFLTGTFLRSAPHAETIRRMVGDGHYVIVAPLTEQQAEGLTPVAGDLAPAA